MQEVVLANHSKAAQVYLMDDPAGRDYYQSLETARLSKTGKPKPPNMLESNGDTGNQGKSRQQPN